LRVEAVEAYPIRIKAREKLTGGTFTYNHYTTVLVKAVCDGVDGWGEAMTRSEPGATAMLVRLMARRVVGLVIRGPTEAWDAIWRELAVRGHTRGTDVEALSGLEMALWDCRARLRKSPLNQLLSRKPAEQVRAYAGSLFESRGPIDAQVEAAKSAGLAGAKVKIGFSPRRDHSILRRVRNRWTEGMLVADANGAYDIRTAEKACELFSELDLAWLEEPLLSNDWTGYAELRLRSSVKLGAGESWFVDDFDATTARGLVHVLEPSVSRCGGVGTELHVGRLASRFKLGFSPMTGMNSAVSLAASIHVASAVPAIGVEYNPFANPLQTELAAGLTEPKSGQLTVPKGPGTGLDVDERFVRRYAGR